MGEEERGVGKIPSKTALAPRFIQVGLKREYEWTMSFCRTSTNSIK